MPFSSVAKISLIIALSEVLYYSLSKLYSRVKKKKSSQNNSLTSVLIRNLNHGKKKPSGFHKVLFFPDPGISCPRLQAGRICRDKKCSAIHDDTSLGSLMKIMSFARNTIDVCVYLITCNALGDMLVECHKKDVIVRVITDDRNTGEREEVTGAQIGKLRAAGIAVHCFAGTFWMHHKFMVLDNEILVTGSFNWTTQAAMGNHENLVVTSEPELVAPFVKEFENLFRKLQPDEIQE